MDREQWNARYADRELVWSAGPNQFVEALTAGLPLGRALDLAAGEGRNALWLAARGWQVTAVDFSDVALARAEGLARERLARPEALQLVAADLAHYEPPSAAFDLVLVVYLQVPAALRQPVLRRAGAAVAPGGRLVVVAHDPDNLERGFGGPSDPAVLYSAADVAADVAGLGLTVLRAEQVPREVPTDDGVRTAVDALFVALRGPAPDVNREFTEPSWQGHPPVS